MRYRAVCSAAYASRWLDQTDLPTALRSTAPVVVFDRDDELQDRFLETIPGEPSAAPRHFVPASADFAAAVELGFGWGMLPESQCLDPLADGRMIELIPGRFLDVPLYWQRWNLATPLLDAVSRAVCDAAGRDLLTAQ
jgi:LysR family transcriptional regulator (chromosome initiation inhibitor)